MRVRVSAYDFQKLMMVFPSVLPAQAQKDEQRGFEAKTNIDITDDQIRYLKGGWIGHSLVKNASQPLIKKRCNRYVVINT